MQKPELLSPAGTIKNMKYAFAYGADAIYAGQPRYSLRVRNNQFDNETLAEGIKYAHALDKKFYVVSNIQAHNSKIDSFMQDIKITIDMSPDALIMSDPGLISLVREHFPEQEIHLSVQANAVNWASVKFWKTIGISRVVLSRELSIKEITEIKEKVPDMEIEIFVHGALCMAHSGRCLLSGYINKRDANQGTCTNACRWNYNTYAGKENETGDIVPVIKPSKETSKQFTELQPSNEVMFLEEQGRPGELMPAFEDEHGTYIMNSKDLRAVELIDNMVKSGVHSFKIEGRTKSHYYVARTAQVYRQAIDDSVSGKPFDNSLLTQLDGLANRGYTAGFLQRHIHSEYQNYEYGASKSDTQRFVGEVLGFAGPKSKNPEYLEIDVKNKFSVGDLLEIMTPKVNINIEIKKMLNEHDEEIESALGSGWICRIPNPFKNLDESILKFALIMRYES